MRDYFLQTTRLGFSHWMPGDASPARALWGDKRVTRYLTVSGTLSPLEITLRLREEMRLQDIYGVCEWPVFSLENGIFVGSCGLHPGTSGKGSYSLSFCLLYKYWGQSLATEAGLAAAQYARNVLHAHMVTASHHPDQQSARRVLERIGFHYAGHVFVPATRQYQPSYRFP